jgi:hypothetical protein
MKGTKVEKQQFMANNSFKLLKSSLNLDHNLLLGDIFLRGNTTKVSYAIWLTALIDGSIMGGL